MATPPQVISNSEVGLLKKALRDAAEREDYHIKILQMSIARHTKSEAEVRASKAEVQRLEELCRTLDTSARWWENMFNRVLSNSKADEAHFRAEERNRANAEKAMADKVKVLQHYLHAKHDVKHADPPKTVEDLHIQTLQSEVSDLLKNQEKMEEELNRTTSTAIETVQHVTKSVLALVTEVEKSQPGKMFRCPVKRNVGRKRQRPAEVSEDLRTSNPLEHSKMECYRSIRCAEEALVDATRMWKKTQSEAESMLTVGRKAILDKILGRPEAQE